MKERLLSAQLYHLHHSQDVDDLPFWLQLAQAQDGPVLELGCGTGRVLHYLAQAGQKIFGIDHHENSLLFLRSQLPRAMHQLTQVVLADFTAFRLDMKFGLIIMPCNTLSTLTSSAQSNALICVRQHLRREGVFIACIPNPTLLAELPPEGDPTVETTFPHPLSGNPVQISSNWACTKEAVTFHWHYDHLLTDGRVTRSTVSTKHFRQSQQEIKMIFNECGLTIKALHGDYDQSTYDADSPYLVIMAQAV